MDRSSYLLKSCLFLLALVFLLFLQLYARMLHPGDLVGFHFQNWTSDTLMQTLPINQLRDYPLLSLYYLHIQPPMLDLIRSVLAALSPYGEGKELLRYVDAWLYILWALAFAALAVFIFCWVRNATGSVRVAAAAYLFWLPYPGAIAMSALLDATLLSALFITWFLYEIWLFCEGRGSRWRLAAASILSFFTRSVLQWPFLPVMLIVLKIAGVPWKSILRIGAPILLVMGLYLFKQFTLFGTLSTTSHGGEHKLGMIMYHPTPEEYARYKANAGFEYPESALPFVAKQNNPNLALMNIVDSKIAADRMQCCPLESLQGVMRSVALNFHQLSLPLSQYHRLNPIKLARNLAWRPFYDTLFVKPFAVMIVAASLIWASRNCRRPRNFLRKSPIIVMSAFVLSVIMLANCYQWTETERLKFFLEPAAYVYVVTQATLACRWLYSGMLARWNRRRYP